MAKSPVALGFLLANLAVYPVVAQTPGFLKSDVAALEAAMDPVNGPALREPVFQTPSNFRDLGPPGPYWPERAERLGVNGAVVLQCTISASGVLSECTVLAEAPQNYAFGVASLHMALKGYLSAKPIINGHDGDKGRLVIVFKNPHLHG